MIGDAPESLHDWPSQCVVTRQGFQPFSTDLKSQREPVIVHGEILLNSTYPFAEPTLLQRGRLHDSDVVFVGATNHREHVITSLRHIQGTVVDVFVLWLTQDQIRTFSQFCRQNKALRFCRCDHISLGLNDGPFISRAWTILSHADHLSLDGRPLAHKKHPASKRFLPAMNQEELQTKIDQEISTLPNTPRNVEHLQKWLETHTVTKSEWSLVHEE
jgi:hypothetical protein